MRTVTSASCYFLASFLGMVSCVSNVAEGDSSASERSESTDARDKVASTTIRENIQGGRQTDNYPWAVGLQITKGGGERGKCSGTLIAPNLVLTARHCVASYSQQKDCIAGAIVPFDQTFPPANVSVTNKLVMSDDAQKKSVREILVPEDNNQCGADIALLVLSESLVSNGTTVATPLVNRTLGDSETFALNFTLIGYGATFRDESDAGIKRIMTNDKILCMDGIRSGIASCKTQPSYLRNYTTSREFVATPGGGCSGDSGGGAYEQRNFDSDNPVVYGVFIGGFGSGSVCGKGLFVRTDVHADFITRGSLRAASLGGYAAPAWARGKGTAYHPNGEEKLASESITDKSSRALGSVMISRPSMSRSCAGTMISPNLAMTARHCVLDQDQLYSRRLCGSPNYAKSGYVGQTIPATDLEVTIGALPKNFSVNPVSRPFVKEIFLPGEKNSCGSDIALILLNQTIPEEEIRPAVPFNIYRSPTRPFGYYPNFTYVGFSNAAWSPVPDVIKNQNIRCVGGETSPLGLDKSVGACDGTSDAHTLSITGPLNGSDVSEGYWNMRGEVHANEFAGQSRVCFDGNGNGDVGGVAYEQTSVEAAQSHELTGKYKQYAAVVLGVAAHRPQDQSCKGVTYTRTDAHKDFIIQVAKKAAEVGGYALPFWATPASGMTGNFPESALGTVVVSRSPFKKSCVGTMIAPNLALTAKHCVVDMASASLPSSYSYKCGGSTKDKVKFPFRTPQVRPGDLRVTVSATLPRVVDGHSETILRHAVKEVILPSEDNACGGNIALLLLEESIPEEIARPALPFDQYRPPSKLFGYRPGFSFFGTAVVQDQDWKPLSYEDGNNAIRCLGGIKSVVGQSPLVGMCDGLNDQHTMEKVPNAWNMGSLYWSLRDYVAPNEFGNQFYGKEVQCYGDSDGANQGGVAYEQSSKERARLNAHSGKNGENRALVYGVLARSVWANNGACKGAVFTRTDSYKDLIVNAGLRAAEIGKYAPPMWTSDNWQGAFSP